MLTHRRKPVNKSHTSRLGATSNTSRGDKNTKQMSRKLNNLSEGKAFVCGGRDIIPQQPRPFEAIRVVKIRRRYKIVGALSLLPTIQDLWNGIGGVALTAILWVPAFWSFRIKKLELWSSVSTIGVPVTAQLQDQSLDSAENDFNGRPTSIFDESVSIDYPAHVVMRPVITTPLGSWHNGNARTAVSTFSIACSGNSILDITFECVEPYIFNSNVYTRAIVAGGPGQFSCLGLAGGTNNTIEGVQNL